MTLDAVPASRTRVRVRLNPECETEHLARRVLGQPFETIRGHYPEWDGAVGIVAPCPTYDELPCTHHAEGHVVPVAAQGLAAEAGDAFWWDHFTLSELELA